MSDPVGFSTRGSCEYLHCEGSKNVQLTPINRMLKSGA